MDQSNIPAELVPMMDDFAHLLQTELPHLAVGLYLQGSVALGGFDLRKSDIDYIVLLNRSVLTDDDISRMIAIHEQLKALHPCYLKAEGHYTSVDHLRKSCRAAEDRFPKFFYGVYQGLRSGYPDPTAAWILKHHGIAVFGPEVRTLDITVNWDDIRFAMSYNLNVYWAEKACSPELFLEEAWVEDAVLTLGRIAYTLEYRATITKLAAGDYLLQTLPSLWHSLVAEAMRIRECTCEASGSDPVERARTVLQLIVYMTSECNAKFQLERIHHDSLS